MYGTIELSSYKGSRASLVIFLFCGAVTQCSYNVTLNAARTPVELGYDLGFGRRDAHYRFAGDSARVAPAIS